MVDPLIKFDPETVVKIFSLLSNPDIAISASTSRGWRNQSLTDPIINKVIDLSGLSLNEEKTIELVNHLVSLSSHEDRKVGKEIHLDLSPFWDKLFPHDEGSWTVPVMKMSFNYSALLDAISSSTKGQLSKICLQINEREVDQLVMYSQVEELVIKSTNILDDPFLKEIHWSTPFRFTAVSKGQKVFSINQTERSSDSYCIFNYKSFLQSMNAFTSGGLIKLIINVSDLFNPNYGEEFKGFCDEVWRSKSTLEELRMTFSPIVAPHMFDLVEGMDRLSSLRLKVERTTGRGFQVVPPRGCSSFHLKKLVLELSSCPNEMGWIMDWVGKTLETLQLSLSTMPSLSRLPASVIAAIIENSSSLKHLHLEQISISNDFSSSTYTPNLSNLESLYLNSLNLFGYQFFSNCSMPKLQTLSLGIGQLKFVQEEDIPRFTRYLFNIVKDSCLTLARLSLMEKLKVPINEQQQALAIDFPKLEEINLSDSWKGINDVEAFHFLSSFRFQLKCFKITNGLFPIQSIFKQFLQPSSQDLEEISLDLNDRNVDGNEGVDPNSKELLLSLPNLKSLRIRSGSSHLVDWFSSATYDGSLTHLQLDFSSSKSPFPNSILPLLTSNAFSLKSLTLTYVTHEHFIGSEYSGTGLDFPNLVELYISNLFFLPLQTIFKSSFPKLSKLKLHYSSFDGDNSPKISAFQVLEFIRKTSATLKDLSMDINRFEENEDEILERVTEQVLLRRLRRLSCFQGASINLLRHMVGLIDPGFRHWSSDEQLKKIAEKLPEIAPRVVKLELK